MGDRGSPEYGPHTWGRAGESGGIGQFGAGAGREWAEHPPGAAQPGPASGYEYTEPFDYGSQDAPWGLPRQHPAAGEDGGRAPEGAGVGRPLQPPTEETMRLRPAVAPPQQATPEPGRSGEGRAARRKAAKRVKRRRRLSATKEIPILLVVALGVAVVLKTFLVQAFVIPSGSMEQTIRIGDRVLVDKLTPWFGSKPERGDVVVFRDPGGWLEGEKKPQQDESGPLRLGKDVLVRIGLMPSDDEQDLIKRAVAVGGDRVKCCDGQGRVTVNGTPLREPYLHPGNRPSQLKFDVRVPNGRVFVMGDHRANSADSRFHLSSRGHGTVSEGDVIGRAVVIAWPFDHWRRLAEPAAYASVPDAPGAAPTAGAANGDNRVTSLPSPAVLPLVMGVVGLSRLRDGPWRKLRSERGGLGPRRAIRFWRRRSGRPPS